MNGAAISILLIAVIAFIASYVLHGFFTALIVFVVAISLPSVIFFGYQFIKRKPD
jgi:hypothetical protein